MLSYFNLKIWYDPKFWILTDSWSSSHWRDLKDDQGKTHVVFHSLQKHHLHCMRLHNFYNPHIPLAHTEIITLLVVQPRLSAGQVKLWLKEITNLFSVGAHKTQTQCYMAHSFLYVHKSDVQHASYKFVEKNIPISHYQMFTPTCGPCIVHFCQLCFHTLWKASIMSWTYFKTRE